MNQNLKQSIEYGYNWVKKILNIVGGRASGSEEEKKASKDALEILKECCNDTFLEKFYCHPTAFLGFIRVSVFLFLIGSLLFYFEPIISEIFLILTIILFIEKFINYHEFIDPFFPKKESYNIGGEILPIESPNKTIYITAHMDSAYEFYLIYKNPKTVFLKIGIAISVLIFVNIISILNILNKYNLLNVWSNDNLILIYIFILILNIPASLLYNFTNFKPVPGAFDNLAAVGVILGIGKYLSNLKNSNSYPFRKTKVNLIIFGCEEAGLRGSKRFVKNHIEQLKKENACVINLDGINNSNIISIISKEFTIHTNHDKSLVENFKKLLDQNNILNKIDVLDFGATDAIYFSRNKIPALSLFKVNMRPIPRFYHTRLDDISNISVDSMLETANAILIFIKYLDQF